VRNEMPSGRIDVEVRYLARHAQRGEQLVQAVDERSCILKKPAREVSATDKGHDPARRPAAMEVDQAAETN